MTPQTNTGWSISSLLSMSAVAYAVGVATSDSVQSGFKRVSSHNIRAFFGAPPALELLHKLPSQAQVVDPASFAVIPGVPPPSVANISTVGSSQFYELIVMMMFIFYSPAAADID